MSESGPPIAHPAATVVLLRDGATHCEVLLVRRSRRLSFHGGSWVFPGGRIDPQDYAPGSENDIIAAARQAAVREAREETGLSLVADDLTLISRWITPEPLPKRFDAWFFAAAATDRRDVRVDGGEINAYRWVRPETALEERQAGKLDLPPPTFVTILRLTDHRCAREALDALRSLPLETFAPRVRILPQGACSLYAGDVAYEDDDVEVDAPGPRHRLWLSHDAWRYERQLD